MNIARTQSEGLANPERRSQKYFQNVPDLPVGFWAENVGAGAPGRCRVADGRDLFQGQRLRSAFGLLQLRGALDGVSWDRVVAQRETEQEIQQGSRMLRPGVRHGQFRLQKAFHATGRDLPQCEVLERGQHMQADIVALVLFGLLHKVLQFKICQTQRH